MAKKKTVKKTEAKKTVNKPKKKSAPKLKTIRVETAERVLRTFKELKKEKTK
jgi:hypothetical protein